MDNDRGKDSGPGPGKSRSDREQEKPQPSAGESKTGRPDWTEELEGTFSESGGRKPQSRLKKALLITGGALLLLLIAAGTYVLAFYSEVRETERVLLDDPVSGEQYDLDAAFSERIVNVALLGFDRGWNREEYGEYLFRPDMMAVFSINFETDQISVVRIPRDSYVPLHGMGGFHDKINHSFFYGYYYGGGEDSEQDGLRYTLETLRNALGGIPIHYYVSVDMYSVIELVDAVGGIYYEVEEEIIDKHWEVGRVLVPEGPQLMDGKTFLRYLQYRDSASGQDLGRIDRQMNLLQETFLYLREEGRISDLPAVYRVYKDYVDTDLSYRQIAALAYYARDIDLTDQTLQFYTVPGSGQSKDGIWYLVLNENDRLQIIENVFGLNAERWPAIVLEDSPEYLEEQERLAREEREEGPGPGLDTGKDPASEEDRAPEPGEEQNGEETGGSGDSGVREDGAERVTVPEVRGLTVQEATVLLRKSGFFVGEVSSRTFQFVEEGLVINAEPVSGTRVVKGSEIGLVVSEGPAW